MEDGRPVMSGWRAPYYVIIVGACAARAAAARVALVCMASDQRNMSASPHRPTTHRHGPTDPSEINGGCQNWWLTSWLSAGVICRSMDAVIDAWCCRRALVCDDDDDNDV